MYLINDFTFCLHFFFLPATTTMQLFIGLYCGDNNEWAVRGSKEQNLCERNRKKSMRKKTVGREMRRKYNLIELVATPTSHVPLPSTCCVLFAINIYLFMFRSMHNWISFCFQFIRIKVKYVVVLHLCALWPSTVEQSNGIISAIEVNKLSSDVCVTWLVCAYVCLCVCMWRMLLLWCVTRVLAPCPRNSICFLFVRSTSIHSTRFPMHRRQIWYSAIPLFWTAPIYK